MFLLSPVVLRVLLGLRVLPCPCVRGFSYQGVLVLCLRSVSIRPPSFPAPQVSYGLVVVSPGWSPPLWLFSFTCPTFVHCGLVLCCLSPVCLPHLGRGYVVSSVFVSYAVCLCRLCSWCLRDGVTLAWVECRCCFLPLIGTKATFLSVLSIPSGWGHPLGQVCFLFPLISIEGSLSFWFLFLPLGSRVRCLCLPLVPWVGFIVGLCAPLLCVASLCSVSFLFLGIFLDSTCWPFSPQFHLWLSLIIVTRCFLGPFLPLEFPLRFGWSSGRLVAFCVPLAWLPSLSGSDVPFTCLGFSATCLRVFRGFSTVFSFVRLCFPFFL